MLSRDFTEVFDAVASLVHENSVSKGFTHDSLGTLIALVHSELSEALEGMREGFPASEKIPGYTLVEEELADTIIRIMDMSAAHGWDVSGAILAKMAYNKPRPHKHGKEF